MHYPTACNVGTPLCPAMLTFALSFPRLDPASPARRVPKPRQQAPGWLPHMPPGRMFAPFHHTMLLGFAAPCFYISGAPVYVAGFGPPRKVFPATYAVFPIAPPPSAFEPLLTPATTSTVTREVLAATGLAMARLPPPSPCVGLLAKLTGAPEANKYLHGGGSLSQACTPTPDRPSKLHARRTGVLHRWPVHAARECRGDLACPVAGLRSSGVSAFGGVALPCPRPLGPSVDCTLQGGAGRVACRVGLGLRAVGGPTLLVS
jgi:hypothetical protein